MRLTKLIIKICKIDFIRFVVLFYTITEVIIFEFRRVKIIYENKIDKIFKPIKFVRFQFYLFPLFSRSDTF